VVTAPLVRSPRTNTFYYVALTGISVGGQTLSIPPSAFAMDEAGSGGVIVDSGTAVTRLQQSAYSALRDAFVQGTQSLPRTSGVSLFDTCYDLSGRSSVQVPAVSLRFEGGGELRLPAKNYLIPVDGAGTYCLAFAGTSGAVSILGNVQQQGVRAGPSMDRIRVIDRTGPPNFRGPQIPAAQYYLLISSSAAAQHATVSSQRGSASISSGSRSAPGLQLSSLPSPSQRFVPNQSDALLIASFSRSFSAHSPCLVRVASDPCRPCPGGWLSVVWNLPIADDQVETGLERIGTGACC
jgi:hypothetical protein